MMDVIEFQEQKFNELQTKYNKTFKGDKEFKLSFWEFVEKEYNDYVVELTEARADAIKDDEATEFEQ